MSKDDEYDEDKAWQRDFDDYWEERLRATDQIKKLLALAAGNSNIHEAEAAMNKAQALAKKYNINLQEIQPNAPLSKESKMAAARKNAAAFGAAFKKSYPGQDDEDYTKYEAERKKRAEARKKKDEGFSWGDDEGY